MKPIIDLVGSKFGKLLVLAQAGRSKQNKVMWRCLCDCGRYKDCIGNNLKQGTSTSCGTCVRLDDWVGHVFGKLTVISFAGFNNHGRSKQTCLCECGQTIDIDTCSLVTGNSTSCGCNLVILHTTHGLSHLVEYSNYTNMINRCKNNENYIKRGITVCERWADPKTGFIDFLIDVGHKPETPNRLSIDRINNNLGYFKENCRWATEVEQQNNKSSVLSIDDILNIM